MSRQKFASNVVEKCLLLVVLKSFNLVNEMLGSTDENEPLQAHNGLAYIRWMCMMICKIGRP